MKMNCVCNFAQRMHFMVEGLLDIPEEFLDRVDYECPTVAVCTTIASSTLDRRGVM
jgi:hypothetical protein